jgi:hypothetical protein
VQHEKMLQIVVTGFYFWIIFLISQVQQLFPHLALATVIEDLRVTRSVELTIENVLDGQVVAPPPMFQRDTEPVLPELEYSPGLADIPASLWDDLSENHDPDRSVTDKCDGLSNDSFLCSSQKCSSCICGHSSLPFCIASLHLIRAINPFPTYNALKTCYFHPCVTHITTIVQHISNCVRF